MPSMAFYTKIYESGLMLSKLRACDAISVAFLSHSLASLTANSTS
jgi:hypothetical protein